MPAFLHACMTAACVDYSWPTWIALMLTGIPRREPPWGLERLRVGRNPEYCMYAWHGGSPHEARMGAWNLRLSLRRQQRVENRKPNIPNRGRRRREWVSWVGQVPYHKHILAPASKYEAGRLHLDLSAKALRREERAQRVEPRLNSMLDRLDYGNKSMSTAASLHPTRCPPGAFPRLLDYGRTGEVKSQAASGGAVFLLRCGGR